MRIAAIGIFLALQACLAGNLPAQGVGQPTGWRFPQYDLSGVNFYPYPSPEKTTGPFELVIKWSVPADRAFTGDVNGDGKLELVAQHGGKISVYSGKGVLLSSAGVSAALRLGALQDADGDGVDDLLLAGRERGQLKVLFLRGNGKKIRSVSVKPSAISDLEGEKANLFAAEIIGLRDVDADGTDEVILSLGSGYQWKPRGVLVLDPVTGSEEWYYPVGPGLTQVLTKDINRDSLSDIIAVGYALGNGNKAPDGSSDEASFLYSISGKGRANWIGQVGIYNMGARIAVQDINRDNTEDIVLSGYAAHQYLKGADAGYLVSIGGIDGELQGRFTSAKSLDDRGLVLTDSVDTGLAEIAIGGSEGIVRKFSHKLELLASYASTAPVSVMAANDFTRSRKTNFFALTDDNKLLVLDNDLKLISEFEYPSGGRQAALLVSDLIPGDSNELVLVADKAYVLTAATRPEEQFGVNYKVLKDYPLRQLADMKNQDAAGAVIVIKNKTGREARLRVRHAVEGQKELTETITIPPNFEKDIELFPGISSGKGAGQGTVLYRITVDRAMSDGSYAEVSSHETELRLHPEERFFPAINDAAGKRINLLASLVKWVDPFNPEVAKIVDEASRLGRELNPRINIVGDQPLTAFRGNPDKRTLEEKDKDYLDQIALAYKAMQKLYAPTYKNAPLVLSYKAGVSQVVQSPADTLQKSGNCIDNSVLFASILERMDFKPLLVYLLDEGHVIVGWSVTGTSADGIPARKYRFLEPNKFSPDIGFREALAAGQAWGKSSTLKSPPPAGMILNYGLFTTEDGSASLMDVQAVRMLMTE